MTATRDGNWQGDTEGARPAVARGITLRWLPPDVSSSLLKLCLEAGPPQWNWPSWHEWSCRCCQTAGHLRGGRKPDIQATLTKGLGTVILFTEHRSVVGNEDEGSISNNSSPSATESSRIDEMFMETKKYDRTCQVPDEGERQPCLE